MDAPPHGRPRIAVWAYACNPDRGSDGGATWAYVRALAVHADLVVLHSPDDTRQLTSWHQRHPKSRIEFVEVAEPRSVSLLRRAFRLHRQLRFVNYLSWLRAAFRLTQRLHVTTPFDAVAHASYGNYWLPSPVWKLGIPSLWGPVGGGVRTPPRLLPALGIAGLVAEFERSLGLCIAGHLPSTRETQREVSVPIVETEETRQRLTSEARQRAVLVNRVALIDPVTAGAPGGSGKPSVGIDQASAGTPEFLFTSSLWGKKGTRLAVRALAHADPHARLAFVNEGYDESSLAHLARRLGVEDRVSFEGRIPRDELFARMATAAGLLFPGLREEGGLALTEAMYQGLPVIVLGHGGSGLIASQALDPARVRIVVPGNRDETARRLGLAMTQLLKAPSTDRSSTLDAQPHLNGLVVALEVALPAFGGRFEGNAP